MFKWIATVLVTIVTILAGYTLNGISESLNDMCDDIEKIERHLSQINGNIGIHEFRIKLLEKIGRE